MSLPIPGRIVCSSPLVRGEATDCRPETQRWMIGSGRFVAENYYDFRTGFCGLLRI